MIREFRNTTFITALLLVVLLSVGGPVLAQDRSAGEPGRGAAGPNPLKNVYFGEQHIHTTNSPDAFVVGTRGTW